MIITDSNLLRTPCVPVLSNEVDEIVIKLEEELKQSGDNGFPGIGLAAPQIGIYKTLAIVRLGKESVNLVNCRIEKGYDLSFFDGEGCLSFPGESVRTKRYREIYVVDNMVKPYSFVAIGLLAVCIQHELDHLKGVLLPDVAVR